MFIGASQLLSSPHVADLAPSLSFAPTLWVSFAIILWLVWAWASNSIMSNPRGEPGYGLGFWALRTYAHLVHRFTISGLHNLPSGGRLPSRPVIVVVNHTAGIDPILVQLACPFEIRWMMGRDMMLPAFDWVWNWLRVIPVDRRSARGDMTALRLAIRHLEAPHAAIGVFPEGAIAKPRGSLLPFAPGVGLIVAKSNASVLPILIQDTPNVPEAWQSLWTPSRSRLCILPTVSFPPGTPPAAITQQLRDLFVASVANSPQASPTLAHAQPL